MNDMVVKQVLSVMQAGMSFDVDGLSSLAASIGSSQYATRRMQRARRFADSLAILEFAAREKVIDGLVLEFGVWSGTTINHLAGLLPSTRIYGFDSFEGLPESWRPGYGKGKFARGDLPAVRDNVELVVGWFDRTLPVFLDAAPHVEAALIHVDCDLYSSTKIIFHHLRDRIVPGTIIVFDEYFNYPGWEAHEFLAFQEYVNERHLHYEYLGLVPNHQQVAVQIIG